MKSCLFFIIVILAISKSNSFFKYRKFTDFFNDTILNYTFTTFKTFDLLNISRSIEKSYNDTISEYIVQNISKKCQEQFNEFVADLNVTENSWALKMIDATSKLQSGIMTLNAVSLGNFDECISIKTNKTQFKETLGKYCLGSLKIHSNFSQHNQTDISKFFMGGLKQSIPNIAELINASRAQNPTWAICVPDGCSAQDVTFLVNFVVQKVIGNGISMEFTDLLCQTNNDVNKNLSIGAIITIIFLAIVFSIMCLSSVYDYIGHVYKLEPKHSLLIVFSMYTNVKKLFTIKESTYDTLPCLDGLKVCSIIWVVAGHVYSLLASGPIVNTLDLKYWSDSLVSMFLVSGTLSVDTFFVISAALLVYNYRKLRHERQKFSLFYFYLHRYLRLTPSLAAVVLISATLLNYLGSGPYWPLVEVYFQNYCATYWWSTLLYVQNYVNVNKMCLGQTWYLSIDTQLYIISPIFLICLIKWRKSGLCIASLGVIIPMILSFWSSWTNNLSAIISNYYANAEDFNNKYYLLTHTRASSWFIGFLLGHFIFEFKNNLKEWNFKKYVLIPLWILCGATLLTCTLVGHESLRQKEYFRAGNAFHIALVRPFWCAAISFIIYACISNNGGIVNEFLSLPIFQVLNRFTYSIYLTHVTMLYMITYAKKTPDYFNSFNAAYQFWGALGISFVLSLGLILAFESPAIAIEKIIRAKFSGHDTAPTANDSQIEDEPSTQESEHQTDK